jgi:phosphoglycolate phosphatase-like HAD superfamily hydrolase
MKRIITSLTLMLALVVSSLSAATAADADDPLPSWNDGDLKERILAWVDAVTDRDSPDFVPEEERIAVLDVDGTMWAERPYYNDALFAADRVAELAPDNPDWADQLPFAPIVAGDYDVLNSIAGTDFIRMMHASYGDASDAEWEEIVEEWFATSTNEALGRTHDRNTYLPMMELLELLDASGFTSYLVTAAEEQFIRAVADDIFGIPRERVIGVEMERTLTEAEDGTLSLTREGAVDLANEREGKALHIFDVVGRTPIFAAGNSDGDYHMMKWTTSGDDTALAILVLHDDAEREFDYARVPTLGGQALEADPEWAAVSMKDDWATVFAE